MDDTAPIPDLPPGLSKTELMRILASSAADPELREDLAALGDESTDDLGRP